MTNATDTKLTLVYETETCGRCGGSGHYSYNMMHGTTCFGCSGRKIRNTKAGAKASKAIQEFIAANFSVLAKDLKVGDVIKYDGYTRTLTAISTDGGSKYGQGKDAAGETIWMDYVSVTFNKPVPSQFGPFKSAGLCQEQKVQKAVMGADWNRVIEFARTIKKGVTVVAKATA